MLTSHLRCLCGSLWTKLQALCFHWKALSATEALLFDLYKQTTITRVDTRARSMASVGSCINNIVIISLLKG